MFVQIAQFISFERIEALLLELKKNSKVYFLNRSNL